MWTDIRIIIGWYIMRLAIWVLPEGEAKTALMKAVLNSLDVALEDER